MHRFCLIAVLTFSVVFASARPKIAIIGGGIGGTSCAYFLRELFGKSVSLSLFEQNEVGGRLKNLNVDGNYYEAGGSILHPKNEYMIEITKLLNLRIQKLKSSKLGIYNGENFVFEENESSILTFLKLIWKYGISNFHLNKHVTKVLDDLNRIYTVQQEGYAFSSVSLLLDVMNPTFAKMTQTTLSEILKKDSFSDKFLDEFVQAITMLTYGQTNNITGLVGFVALSATDSNLWSVKGGNKLVPEGLLKKSEADFTHASVSEVILMPDGTFIVKYIENVSLNVNTQNFDIVVISSPLMTGNDDISFVNFSTNIQNFRRVYHPMVSTFVKGVVNPGAFNTDSLPNFIAANTNTLLFNSIGEVYPVDDSPVANKVYKILSKNSLDKESIKKLFKHAEIVKEEKWLACPFYEKLEELVPFVLHPKLYYTNAIEISTSDMERSVVAAKNVALLIFNELHNLRDKIDNTKLFTDDEENKIEL